MLTNLKKGHSFDKPVEYKQIANPQYLLAHEIIKTIGFKPNNKILDIGCGDGKITSDLAKMVPQGQVIGTDISKEMIEFATNEYKSEKNIKFMTMDAAENIFCNQFDLVTSFSCLHWVEAQSKALVGIRNALHSNGKAILLIIQKMALETITESIASTPKWKHYFYGFNDPKTYFSLEQYRNLLDTIGFSKKTVEEDTITHQLNTRKDLELWLGATSPYMKKIPTESQNEFLFEIVDMFIRQENLQSNHSIPLSAKILLVQAIK